MTRIMLAALAVLVPAAAWAAAEGGAIEHAHTNLDDTPSLQRGAKYYINYCSGCHSLKYHRYQRIAKDLGLSESQVEGNLMFATDDVRETMTIAMSADDGEQWLGTAPPDLSLVARSRGSDWIFTYLQSFYRDDSTSSGWNNKLLENTSMPHVLWRLQGIQEPVYKTVEEHGEAKKRLDHLELVEPGELSPVEYEQVSRDIAAFLEYVGEPAKLYRMDIGIWVVLFLAAFAFILFLLKREYWRDVH